MRKKLSAIFLCFLAYAIIGWCYEVFLEVFIYKWGFFQQRFPVRAILSCLWLWYTASAFLPEGCEGKEKVVQPDPCVFGDGAHHHIGGTFD